jgi:proteasome lid subunit RPN8/RPN11
MNHGMSVTKGLHLQPGVAKEIIAHAREGYPEEVCGIIAGGGGSGIAAYRGQNRSSTPCEAYELDTETLARQIDFEDAGLALAALYHSHPTGPEVPSELDVERAFYPDSSYVICSLVDPARPVLRAFQIADGAVREVELTGISEQGSHLSPHLTGAPQGTRLTLDRSGDV